MQPKVSVIMPSLNVGPYIRECIDSVVNQTLKEIEIICVDAGSTDGTLDVLEEYAARDHRITVIHSEKKSYGYQMNLGIDAAKGEYIGIVETDDYILPTMYENLYRIAHSESADVCKGECERFWGERESRTFEYVKLSQNTLYNQLLNARNNPQIMRYVNLNQPGIYLLSFLRKKDVRFNASPGASYQDNGFWFQVTVQAERVYYVNKAYYMLRRDNPNSSVKSRGKVYDMCSEYDFIREFLCKHTELEQVFSAELAHCRMRNYCFTLKRIAPEYKLGFLQRFAEDFRKIEADGELDANLYSRSEWRKIHAIMECPEYVYYTTYYQSKYPYRSTQTERLKRELNDIRTSWSFRVGRAITWLPRKIRGGIRCYREHGLRYTYNRLLIHLHLKKER